jgi:hypothetical protein
MVKVRLERRRRLDFQTAGLAAALVLKLIVLAGHRPRYLDDARDVAALLAVVRREPEAALQDLRTHARRKDVALAVASLAQMFGNERDRGCLWIEQESGTHAALTAVDDANWLLRQLKPRRSS